MIVKAYYKDAQIGQLTNDGVLHLETGGQFCEDDITIKAGYQYPDIAIPSGYRKIQYLQSSGTQYINTGILPVSGISVEIVAQLTPTALSEERCYIVGSTGAETSGRIQYSVTRAHIFIGYGASSDSTDGRGLNDSYTHVFLIEQGRCYIDDVKIHTLNSSAFNPVQPIYLFALNNIGSLVRLANGLRILRARFYTSSAVLGDFVPLCRDSDNKLFMYDFQNDTLLPNAGTGEFIAGPDV